MAGGVSVSERAGGATTRRTNQRRAVLAGIALVVLAGVLPYLRTLGHGFTLDDANAILGHRGVQERLGFDDVFLRDWWGRSRFDSIGTWRPLATLTFWVDRHLGGGSPLPFHATNLALYGGLLLLLERFLARWCGGALSDAGRLLAVLAFGTLAVHADVIPSPTGRAEILAALFSLGAIYAATCGRILGAREAVVAAGALFLALLSKESAAPMAVVVPLLAHRAHFEKKTFRGGALTGLALASPLALGAVVAFRVLKMPFMSLGPERAMENPLLAVDTPHRLAGALDVLGLYAKHALTGTGMAPDYSFSEPPILRDGLAGIALGGAVLGACAWLVVRDWKRAPRVAEAALCFGASYLPVSNLVVAASAIADRLFFFPSMWLVVTGALVVERSGRSRGARQLACAAALAFAGVQGARASAYGALWHDDVTLLGAAARAYPDVFRTQRNLAHALADARHGEDDPVANADAAWHLTVAETIYASYPVPVARDAISPAWDAEPLPARLAHLRDLFGGRDTCDALTRAAVRLRNWDDPAAAAALTGGSRVICPP